MGNDGRSEESCKQGITAESNKDKDKEIRKRKADNFAWAKRKGNVMLSGLLPSDCGEEEEEPGKETKKKEEAAE